MPLKSRQQFIQEWKTRVAGIIGLGSEEVRRVHSGPFESVAQWAKIMTQLGPTAEKLLGELYDDMALSDIPPPTPPTKPLNGTHPAALPAPRKEPVK